MPSVIFVITKVSRDLHTSISRINKTNLLIQANFLMATLLSTDISNEGKYLANWYLLLLLKAVYFVECFLLCFFPRGFASPSEWQQLPHVGPSERRPGRSLSVPAGGGMVVQGL